MDVIRSTCNYCSIACNLDFHVEDGEIKRVVPTVDYPVNAGFCCTKGLNLDKQNTKFHNPVLPLMRDEEGLMRQISWDDAFKLFAKRVLDIQNKNGKESFAFLSTGQLATEEMALIGHIGRNFLGGNGDGNTRLCMATSVVAYKQSFGFDAPPYTLKDLEESDVIILIGSNPVVCHPILWSRVRSNKRNAKLIAVDPRRSETVTNCDIWYDIKPKSDLIFLYTLANVLIEKEWIDKEYIEKYTEDFEGFKEHVKSFTLDKVERETGISSERMLELAEIIHNGKRVSLWWTMGINQGYQAVRNAQAIINIALMTGNIGRIGTGANSITGQCNAMGSRLFSNTTGFYGGGEYSDPARRKRIAEVLGMEEEIYGDTDTAKYCHLLLPSTNGLKKEGVLINTERRLSKLNPVLKKEKDELTDYDIMLGVGKALGMGNLLDKWKTPRDAFEVLKECSKGMPCDITGVDYDKLKDSRGVQWPCRKGEDIKEDERRLFEDNKFYTPSKKAKFMYEDVAAVPIEPSEEYPYLFNSGRGTVGQWHTQTRTREIYDVEAIIPRRGYVNINNELAEELDIKENDIVKISSANGVSNEFLVKLSRTVKKNHIYAPMHYIETNSLLPSIFDTYSKEPSFKYVPVKIEKIS